MKVSFSHPHSPSHWRKKNLLEMFIFIKKEKKILFCYSDSLFHGLFSNIYIYENHFSHPLVSR